tara:strand:+ start:80857 stop:81033 length:177 start_codon:yes stop_codon:yes gene_type:complete
MNLSKSLSKLLRKDDPNKIRQVRKLTAGLIEVSKKYAKIVGAGTHAASVAAKKAARFR